MIPQLVTLYQNFDGTKVNDPKLLDRLTYDAPPIKVGDKNVIHRVIIQCNRTTFAPIEIPGVKYSAPFFPTLILYDVTSATVDALRTPEFLKILKDLGIVAFDIRENGPASTKLCGVADFLAYGSGNQDEGKPIKLDNGMWFNDQGDHFTFMDARYPNPADAPLQSIAQKLKYLMPHYPEVRQWINQNPPPQDAKSIRDWYRQLVGICIQSGWNLLWKGVLHTNHHSVRSLANALRRCDQFAELKWDKDARIQVMYLGQGAVHQKMSLNSLLNPSGSQGDPIVQQARSIVADNLDIIAGLWKKPKGRMGESLIERIDSHLSGNMKLFEWLSYDQLLGSTIDHWPVRLRTVRDVKTKPPEMVMLKNGDIDLAFDFVTPSTSGKPHLGNITFLPNSGKNIADKVKGWWDKVKTKFKKWRGQEVPKAVLSGGDLRKMKCKVSCDCEDYLYRMEVANNRQGASDIKHSNGQNPNITNPNKNPGLCKHLLGCLRYLSNTAEMSVGEDGKIEIEYAPVMDSNLAESTLLEWSAEHKEEKAVDVLVSYPAEITFRRLIVDERDATGHNIGVGPAFVINIRVDRFRGTTFTLKYVTDKEGKPSVLVSDINTKLSHPVSYEDLHNWIVNDLEHVEWKPGYETEIANLFRNGSLTSVIEPWWTENISWMTPRNNLVAQNFDESTETRHTKVLLEAAVAHRKNFSWVVRNPTALNCQISGCTIGSLEPMYKYVDVRFSGVGFSYHAELSPSSSGDWELTGNNREAIIVPEEDASSWSKLWGYLSAHDQGTTYETFSQLWNNADEATKSEMEEAFAECFRQVFEPARSGLKDLDFDESTASLREMLSLTEANYSAEEISCNIVSPVKFRYIRKLGSQGDMPFIHELRIFNPTNSVSTSDFANLTVYEKSHISLGTAFFSGYGDSVSEEQLRDLETLLDPKLELTTGVEWLKTTLPSLKSSLDWEKITNWWSGVVSKYVLRDRASLSVTDFDESIEPLSRIRVLVESDATVAQERMSSPQGIVKPIEISYSKSDNDLNKLKDGKVRFIHHLGFHTATGETPLTVILYTLRDGVISDRWVEEPPLDTSEDFETFLNWVIKSNNDSRQDWLRDNLSGLLNSPDWNKMSDWWSEMYHKHLLSNRASLTVTDFDESVLVS